jgi:hypothetical protein
MSQLEARGLSAQLGAPALTMTIRIADDDGGWEMTIPLEIAVSEALRVQMARLQADDKNLPQLCRRIAERMAISILEVLDVDLKPPTEAQISYALAIARDLNVNLPGEALLFRGAMSDFLDRFIPLFNQRHGRAK